MDSLFNERMDFSYANVYHTCLIGKRDAGFCRNIFLHPAVFSSFRTIGFFWEDVEEFSGEKPGENIYCHYEGDPFDAAAFGSLFRPLLCI